MGGSVKSVLAQMLRERARLEEELARTCCERGRDILARLRQLDKAIAREVDRGAQVYLDHLRVSRRPG
ncbi:MAG: hypothetical protein ACUVRC_08565 [Desulfotomaculales bacterium]